MKRESQWQYRNGLSEEWRTDYVAMANPKMKTFAHYQKHVARLNKTFNKHSTQIECREFNES